MEPGAFREIPYMGVIYVVAEAMKLGFRNGHPEWSNLGQGQPEVGPMTGAPDRIHRFDLEPSDHAYGPVGGIPALRESIAAHYNRLYRNGHPSQYTAENVSVVAGGRLALTRVFAALRGGRLGYQVPDYTAYEDMIGYHLDRLDPVLVETDASEGYRLALGRLRAIVESERLSAYVLSNPCNPTGCVVEGTDLAGYVETGRKTSCAFIFDEFYSHFIYGPDGLPGDGPVSAARFVEDVDRDPILLVDGLTKGFRYPGWRLGWVVGPKSMIETLGRAASAIDGGPSCPVQRAALAVLEPRRADQETRALREVFARKRRIMRQRLSALGVQFPGEGRGTFYLWGRIDQLPAPLCDAERFFREGLRRKVMTVPGVFFDVNPGKRRQGPSPLAPWVRFSFGPPEANVEMGLDRLADMVEDARTGRVTD